MKVIIVKNYEEASQEAAKIFINQVKENPQSILGSRNRINTYKNV